MALYPDGSKPNHYSHDSLGDPYACTDDGHNHPEEDEMTEKRYSSMEKAIITIFFGGVALLFAFGLIALYWAASAVF